MIARPALLLLPIAATALVASPGCGPSPATAPDRVAADLPPAYTRDMILDPRLAEAGRAFTAWAESQRAGDRRVFGRVEVLPPAPTLLPYGIGTYQKETRFPVILITGEGWSALTPEAREGLAVRAFGELNARLGDGGKAPSVPPTLTIQTPQGLELGWINQLEPGRKLLHGDE